MQKSKDPFKDCFENVNRVKSGKFGRSAKFGKRPCLIHILTIGIKNKLTKQTVKILMRRLVSSGFALFANVCPNLPGVRSYPTLPIAGSKGLYLFIIFTLTLQMAGFSGSRGNLVHENNA